MLRSTVEKVSAPSDKDISWLNHTPHAAAVYASWPSLPPAHATLASRWLATPYLGWTFTSGSRQPPGAFLNPSYTSATTHLVRICLRNIRESRQRDKLRPAPSAIDAAERHKGIVGNRSAVGLVGCAGAQKSVEKPGD